jgi:hypothetical protein
MSTLLGYSIVVSDKMPMPPPGSIKFIPWPPVDGDPFKDPRCDICGEAASTVLFGALRGSNGGRVRFACDEHRQKIREADMAEDEA